MSKTLWPSVSLKKKNTSCSCALVVVFPGNVSSHPNGHPRSQIPLDENFETYFEKETWWLRARPLQNIVIFLCLADKFSVSLRQLRQTIYPILSVFPDFGPLSLSSAPLLRSEKKYHTDFFSSFLALWRQTAEPSKTNSSFSKWILDGLKQR